MPAFWALADFWLNVHVPRRMSTALPAGIPAKSAAAQPSAVDVVVPVLASDMVPDVGAGGEAAATPNGIPRPSGETLNTICWMCVLS